MKTDVGSPRKNSDSIKFWGIVALLLAVHAGLAIDAARQLSVTHDEYWHLPVGLLTWRTGRFDFDNLNPPLTRLWSALPLSVTGCQTGDIQNAHDAFGYGDAFRAAHSDDYDRQFFAGRIMTVLLSVVSGAWLASWSRQLFGTRGGLLTAALWAFCPNVLANAGLVTPDIGLTGAFIVTLHAAWRFARTPSWKSAGWLGLCLGAAQLVKFTSLLLYPLILVAWGGVRWLRRDPSVASVPFQRGLALWACALLLSLLTLNAGYLFRGTGAAIESYAFGSRSLTWFNTAPAWVRSLPVPFPRDYLAGLDRQRQIMEGAHPVFLDGEWRTHGFPQYYLWALAYKTPHGVQAIGLLTVVAWLFVGGRGRPLGVGLLALSGMLLLLLFASTSGMQLGLRYVLPVYPLLYLIAGQVPRVVANWRPIPSQLGRGLLLVGVISLPFAARFHPEHLAYFNELSGGPATGEQHLLDSNIDWGQDLRALRDHLKQKGHKQIGLAYFGMVAPASYGINYQIPPGYNPTPGWHAVSVNFVRGRPHTIREPQGTIRSVGIAEFAYFQYFTPKARIGASIDLFYLTPEDVRQYYFERQKLAR